MTTTTPVQRAKPKTKIFERTTSALELVAATGIILMTMHVLANVIMRSAFNSPVQGTNEYVGYIWLPAIVMIGFLVSVVRRQIIDADIVYSKFPKQIRREVRFFTSLLSAVVTAAMAWYSFPEAMHALSIGENAPASTIYIAPIFLLPVPVFAAMAVLFTIDAVNAIRGKFDDEGFGLLDVEGPDLLKEKTSDQ